MKRRLCIIEQLLPRLVMAGDWQNASLRRDVDNSSLVTPLDVLLLINNLNSEGTRELPSRSQHSDDPFYDVDGDQWLTPLDPLIVINAINRLSDQQPKVVGGLAPASDPNNNGIVLSANVVINGQTLASSIVTVSLDRSDSIPNSVEANDQGRFTVQLTLAEGLQTVRLSARDDLGRNSDKTFDVRRGNTIQDWNASALDIVRQWTTTSNDPYQGRIVTSQPPLVARNLAMIHAAMFDAANAVSGQYQAYRVSLPLQMGASPSAAAAAAASQSRAEGRGQDSQSRAEETTLASDAVRRSTSMGFFDAIQQQRQPGSRLSGGADTPGPTAANGAGPGGEPCRIRRRQR